LPPSIAALEQRLKHRAQDSDDVIARRVQNATGEIAHAVEFDYVIINENFDTALTQLVGIARASRCRFGQQAAKFGDLFAGLGIQT
jgi:guanylate kinase